MVKGAQWPARDAVNKDRPDAQAAAVVAPDEVVAKRVGVVATQAAAVPRVVDI